MKNVFLLIRLFFCVCLLSACASRYTDPALLSQPGTVAATLEAHGGEVNSSAVVQMIDGVRRPPGFFSFYDLAPGTRSIQFILNSPHHKTAPITRTFLAESGKVYSVQLSIDPAMKSWNVFIVDKRTGDRVDNQK
jgi:predicted methyltransferase